MYERKEDVEKSYMDFSNEILELCKKYHPLIPCDHAVEVLIQIGCAIAFKNHPVSIDKAYEFINETIEYVKKLYIEIENQ